MELSDQPSPPEFAFTDAAPTRVVGAAAVALPLLAGEDGPELGPGSAELIDDLGLDLLDLLETHDLRGAAGEVFPIPLVRREDLPNPSLHTALLVGVGDASPAELRRAGAALARAAKGLDAVVSSVAAVGDDDCLVAFVEGVVLASFGFALRSEPRAAEATPVRRVVLAQPAAPQALHRALALAGAGWLARTLATVPSNIKNPAWLADQAVQVAERSGLEVQVWDEQRLAKEGFGGILAVGAGSVSPPRFVRLDYKPAKGARKAPHVVLVGKGITFDTGGLSIKPGSAMVNMKRDMTGAAVVLGVLSALAELGCPLRVTGLLCIAENSVGGSSMRPGDVITHYGGRTTEVLNTDAEGRLVLADGLAYAAARIKPEVVVDVATLTGAVKVALGLQTGGLYTNRDALAERLLGAGAEAGEPLWRLPIATEYQSALASRVADSTNHAEIAASLTATLFLRSFVGELPWVHLDIASVGDSEGDRDEWTPGPTGFGARMLLRWLTGADPIEGVS